MREVMRGDRIFERTLEGAIALKEANETQYWLELLHQSDYIDAKGFDSINQDCIELLKLLTAIVKSTKAS